MPSSRSGVLLADGLVDLAASFLCANRDENFADFIGVVAKGMFAVTIAERFFDPFPELCFGFFATTADGGESGEVKFLIFDAVDSVLWIESWLCWCEVLCGSHPPDSHTIAVIATRFIDLGQAWL